MNQRNSIKLTQDEALAYVASRHNCALATNGRDGYPHVVAMWYTVSDGKIMMTSYARAQKVVNLKRDPRATLMVESGAKYKELKGVMIRGCIELIEALAALPDIVRLTGADPNNPAALKRVQKRVLMRFHPERWASWDHSKIAGDY
jgi:PPOX class probable F420-dependent enzyme